MKYHDCDVPHFCEICGGYAEAHEIVSRGSGGPREPWNQIFLCREHHAIFHALGRVQFARRFPQFEARIRTACKKMGRKFPPSLAA
jgi:hypothetical protein